MKAKNRRPKKEADGRGKHPTDPNRLAKWIVEQSTGTADKDDRKEEKS